MLLSLIISWIPATITFIAILAVLVLIHEWGHYMAARRVGMIVDEFGFGFGPRLLAKKRGDTTFTLNLLPLGGYVKIRGEDQASREPGSFTSKGVGARIFVVVAGVLMNFILAYVAIALSMWLSYPPLVSDPGKYGVATPQGGGVITQVQEESLASRIGLVEGDIVSRFGDTSLPDTTHIRETIQNNRGGEVILEVTRGTEILSFPVPIGEEEFLGIILTPQIPSVSYTWWKVPYFALLETLTAIWMTFTSLMSFFAGLIMTRVVPAEVMGPVGIFGITAAAVKLGFAYVLSLTTILSINLGIINILPFPALDGGRFVFLLAEKIRGRKVAERVEGVIHQIGFILLIILIVLVTYRDIVRL